MRTKIIEAVQGPQGPNHGKFMVGQLEDREWETVSVVAGDRRTLMSSIGYWHRNWVWVLDLQTGEGAFFQPDGSARADLDKHRIWVCLLYEPFLDWLYQQDLSNLDALSPVVELPDAPAGFQGYRRPGPAEEAM